MCNHKTVYETGPAPGSQVLSDEGRRSAQWPRSRAPRRFGDCALGAKHWALESPSADARSIGKGNLCRLLCLVAGSEPP